MWYGKDGEMIDFKKYASTRDKVESANVQTFDENMNPHYEFGGYMPECDMSGAYTITQSIIAKVADAQECACIEAIRI